MIAGCPHEVEAVAAAAVAAAETAARVQAQVDAGVNLPRADASWSVVHELMRTFRQHRFQPHGAGTSVRFVEGELAVQQLQAAAIVERARHWADGSHSAHKTMINVFCAEIRLACNASSRP